MTNKQRTHNQYKTEITFFFILSSLLALFIYQKPETDSGTNALIRAAIHKHNRAASARLWQAAEAQWTQTRTQGDPFGNKDSVEKFRNHFLQDFKCRWNQPYLIFRDTALTPDKYFAFCQANGYDPVYFIEYLR
jgi:hypothetical protein